MDGLTDILWSDTSTRTAGAAHGTTEHNHQNNGQSPLMAGMLYNLHFITTYQWCLLLLTAFVTLTHWISTYRLRSHSHNAQQNSRLLNDSAAQQYIKIDADANENSSLLQHDTPQVSIGKLLSRRLRSVLIHHPTWMKDLPANDTSLFVTSLLALNIFYACYRAPLSRPLIYIFADRTGLLFVANLPWLYLLSAKNQPFRLLTGASYEQLNILHRALGKWLATLAVAHATGMVIVWYDFLLPRGLDLWWYLTRNIIWLGIAAFLCYEILLATSLVQFRQWWYELFLGTHIVLQTGGLVFLFFHHPRTSLYVGIALSIFLLDRLFYRLSLKTRTFPADLSVFDDQGTVMISASWHLKTCSKLSSWLLPRHVQYGWKTTDHVFLTVPALSKKHRLQAHPFTIASAAPEPGHSHAWLNLIIRARDGFTNDLLNHARLNSTAIVRLDGPYGSTHAVDMLADSELAIIVAGGSGIAVAFPLISHLLHGRQSAAGLPNVCLIWIVNDARHIDWIGHERLDELKEQGLILVMPPPTAEVGRPDVPLLLKDSIRQLTNEDLNTKTAVVVSGPDAMNRAVRNACSKMAWQGRDVNVAVEVFDW